MATHLFALLGGLAIFLHGLDQAKKGLQLAAGDRLRGLINAITSNRMVGAGTGLLVTVVLQSSTAVTLMMVDYCASGLCGLPEALAVLFGAGVGTTLIVQIITFRIASYALLIVLAGVLLMLRQARGWPRYLGQVLVGLGLLFFGLEVMADGVEPLLRGSGGPAALSYLSSHPIASVAAAAFLTVLLQGSAPTIGLVLSVAQAGALSLEASLPFVLGANIGTTLTPLLHALPKPIAGRRAAAASVGIKLLGAVVCLPVLGPLARAVAATAHDPGRQIANAHTLYNVALGIVGLALLDPMSRAVTRWCVPAKEVEPFHARHLLPEGEGTPAFAFGQAMRELLTMADIVVDMLRETIGVFEKSDLDRCDAIENLDDKVDILNREIRFYLARLGADMTPGQSHRQMQLINVCSDLEAIGDVINRGLIRLARKKAEQGLHFSSEGLGDLQGMHRLVVEAFDTALAAFTTSDEELGRRAWRQLEQIRAEEDRLRRAHIERLQRSLRESLETSSIHLDVLADLGLIASLLTNMIAAASRRARSEGVRGT